MLLLAFEVGVFFFFIPWNRHFSQDAIQGCRLFLAWILLNVFHFHRHDFLSEANSQLVADFYIAGRFGLTIIDLDTALSQTSFASVRRLIRRDTFKYLSSLIAYPLLLACCLASSHH